MRTAHTPLSAVHNACRAHSHLCPPSPPNRLRPGELLLLEAGELKAVLAAAPADGNSIDSIVSYSKGFVCGAGGRPLRAFGGGVSVCRTLNVTLANPHLRPRVPACALHPILTLPPSRAADGGVIYVFEKSDDKDYYKKSKSFKIENNSVKILNLAVSPSEEQLVCTLANSQAYVFTLSNTDILKADEMNFELLSQARM